MASYLVIQALWKTSSKSRKDQLTEAVEVLAYDSLKLAKVDPRLHMFFTSMCTDLGVERPTDPAAAPAPAILDGAAAVESG